MEVRRYSHIMHLESTVTGRARPRAGRAFDVVLAAFPAGTLSGAPKVRAMEIIDELEVSRRGALRRGRRLLRLRRRRRHGDRDPDRAAARRRRLRPGRRRDRRRLRPGRPRTRSPRTRPRRWSGRSRSPRRFADRSEPAASPGRRPGERREPPSAFAARWRAGAAAGSVAAVPGRGGGPVGQRRPGGLDGFTGNQVSGGLSQALRPGRAGRRPARAGPRRPRPPGGRRSLLALVGAAWSPSARLRSRPSADAVRTQAAPRSASPTSSRSRQRPGRGCYAGRRAAGGRPAAVLMTHARDALADPCDRYRRGRCAGPRDAGGRPGAPTGSGADWTTRRMRGARSTRALDPTVDPPRRGVRSRAPRCAIERRRGHNGNAGGQREVRPPIAQTRSAGRRNP